MGFFVFFCLNLFEEDRSISRNAMLGSEQARHQHVGGPGRPSTAWELDRPIEDLPSYSLSFGWRSAARDRRLFLLAPALAS